MKSTSTLKPLGYSPITFQPDLFLKALDNEFQNLAEVYSLNANNLILMREILDWPYHKKIISKKPK